MNRFLGGIAVVVVGVGTAVGVGGAAPASAPAAAPGVRASLAASLAAAPSPVVRAAAAKPLKGIRIALDPGHQLGNHNFPQQINRKVQAGGFTKPCNTTGTATNSGYPEASFNWAVASGVKRRLDALGATVSETRTSNTEKKWGPCVDKRGELGEKVGARLEVSLHADGSSAGNHGFHVIAPTSRKPWTNDIAVASLRLAKALRSGLDDQDLARSNYMGGGSALVTRSDLGTLNMSDVPIAMIELGNMRNAGDAKRMRSATGRAAYAVAVVRGIRAYLDR
ncbi:MAG: cell wall hydrolase/autolysin [Marmoricola sp.]|nr:cell wall hydrolase/autolysin [Marmoricola sp.]